MQATLKNLKLIMWEKINMPESKRDEKGAFVKTGNDLEYTGYTFRDEFGAKLFLVSAKNDFRSLEGQEVDLVLNIKYDDYNRKIKVSLDNIIK